MALVTLAVFSYLITSGMLIRDLNKQSSAALSSAQICAVIAIVLHGTCLYYWIDTGLGQNLSLLNMIALFFWITFGGLTILAMLNKPVQVLQGVLAPVIAAALLLAYGLPEYYLIPTNHSLLQLTHILISATAFGVLLMAGCQALLLAIQQYALRHHASSDLIMRLPPLESMELLLFKIIGAGFILLTISLCTGFGFISEFNAQGIIEKIGFALLAWSVFACLLLGRVRYGWRGQRAVQLTLAGFLFLLISYFGSRLLMA